MGTWGHGPFENDDALDFVASFEDGGVGAAEEALDVVVNSRHYVEASDAETAIAAAAFVAAACGEADWLSNQSARNAYNNSSDIGQMTRLKAKASSALARIVGANSELYELWEEAGPAELEQFKATVARLEADLR
jgi:hypothetical protein